jgi:hypothetical protein
MRHLSRATAALTCALSLTLLAACGRDEQTEGGEVSRDSALLGPAVGDSAVKNAADDTIAAVAGRRDVANEKGMSPKEGMDSAAARGAAAAANDSARDIPGVPNMKVRPGETTGPGGTKANPGTKRP